MRMDDASHWLAFEDDLNEAILWKCKLKYPP